MTERNDAFRVLERAKILAVSGLPAVPGRQLGEETNRFLGLAVYSEMGAIYVHAKSYDVAPKEEIFYLTAENLDYDKWLRATHDEGWSPIDVIRFLESNSLADFLGEQRIARFFFDPENSAIPPLGPFASCTAIQLRSTRGEGNKSIILYANSAFPCSIEVVLSAQKQQEILNELNERPVWPLRN